MFPIVCLVNIILKKDFKRSCLSHKNLPGLTNELIRFYWSKIKVGGHFDLNKHISVGSSFLSVIIYFCLYALQLSTEQSKYQRQQKWHSLREKQHSCRQTKFKQHTHIWLYDSCTFSYKKTNHSLWARIQFSWSCSLTLWPFLVITQ